MKTGLKKFQLKIFRGGKMAMKFKLKNGTGVWTWVVPKEYEEFVKWMIKRGYSVQSAYAAVTGLEHVKKGIPVESYYIRRKINYGLRKWNEFLRDYCKECEVNGGGVFFSG